MVGTVKGFTAFGNGDKNSLATRGRANERFEPKTLSGAIRILMKLLIRGYGRGGKTKERVGKVGGRESGRFDFIRKVNDAFS